MPVRRRTDDRRIEVGDGQVLGVDRRGAEQVGRGHADQPVVEVARGEVGRAVGDEQVRLLRLADVLRRAGSAA